MTVELWRIETSESRQKGEYCIARLVRAKQSTYNKEEDPESSEQQAPGAEPRKSQYPKPI